MRVNGRISSRSCQILAVSVGDVLPSSRVPVPLSQTKVNDVNMMLFLPNSNQEIVRFDVSVDEMTRVDVFNSRQHLVSKH